MQGLKNETKFLRTLIFFKRNHSTTKKNLYDVLLLTPKATSADIKTQYYKLSKVYHPDVNLDSTTAADNFRAITEAYEVLGNYRLRKLYDRGIIHTAGKDYSRHAGNEAKTQPYDDSVETETDDPSTRFYKSRLSKHHKTGSHTIYNFDEWTAGHYGDTFKKSQKTKRDQKFYRERATQSNTEEGNKYMTMFILGLICFFALITELTYQKDKLDIDKRIENKDDK